MGNDGHGRYRCSGLERRRGRRTGSLSDGDAVEHAEAKFAGVNRGRRVPVRPNRARRVEILGPNAKACEACGEVFTPDAGDAKREIQRDVGASQAFADGEEVTPEQLEAIADDDALLAKLIEIRSAR